MLSWTAGSATPRGGRHGGIGFQGFETFITQFEAEQAVKPCGQGEGPVGHIASDAALGVAPSAVFVR